MATPSPHDAGPVLAIRGRTKDGSTTVLYIQAENLGLGIRFAWQNHYGVAQAVLVDRDGIDRRS